MTPPRDIALLLPALVQAWQHRIARWLVADPQDEEDVLNMLLDLQAEMDDALAALAREQPEHRPVTG